MVYRDTRIVSFYIVIYRLIGNIAHPYRTHTITIMIIIHGLGSTVSTRDTREAFIQPSIFCYLSVCV